MATYIQFIKKGETEPTPLNTIDEELCQLIGVQPDEKRYRSEWFNFIGQQTCIEGYELGSYQLRDKVMSWDLPELVIFLDYLEKNYTIRISSQPFT